MKGTSPLSPRLHQQGLRHPLQNLLHSLKTEQITRCGITPRFAVKHPPVMWAEQKLSIQREDALLTVSDSILRLCCFFDVRPPSFPTGPAVLALSGRPGLGLGGQFQTDSRLFSSVLSDSLRWRNGLLVQSQSDDAPATQTLVCDLTLFKSHNTGENTTWTTTGSTERTGPHIYTQHFDTNVDIGLDRY